MNLSISRLRQAFLAGKLTPLDVMETVTSKIELGDQRIWISRHSKTDLFEMAKTVMEKDPLTLPLYGIPFGIKDNIDYVSLPTTAACPAFAYQPDRSAFVVEKLIEAGAIPVGKTNLDQFATGLVGTRSPYGIPVNPLVSDRVPGGSSSGSAVAVSAGQVSFALGTDTAGSGRVPAAFNGVVGLKPSRGLLSISGVVPACKTLDCVAVFAKDLTDAICLFDVMNHYDAADPFSRKNSSVPSRMTHDSQLIIGLPKKENLRFFGDSVYEAAWESVTPLLERKKITIKPVDCAVFFDTAKLLYDGPWVAERYCAIEDLIQKSPDALHPVTKSIIEKGNEGSAVDTFKAMYQLAAYKRASEKIFESVDIMITPTAGAHFSLEQVQNDPVGKNNELGYYTNFMNLLDLAAVNIPVRLPQTDRPFGVTCFAPAFSDRFLMDFGLTLGEDFTGIT